MTAPASEAAREPGARLHLVLVGGVQGVGLRPFAHQLARELGVSGWVRNSRRGVEIEVEADRRRCELFAERVCRDAPAPASPEVLERRWIAPCRDRCFEIRASERVAGPSALPLLDLASCLACLSEVRSPGARRHRYPFASCARCGPRYTILRHLPWDRSATSMAEFLPCAACQSEYDDAEDRRFHAQTIACARCGPRLRLEDPTGEVRASGDAALLGAVQALRDGAILALQGLGGFQLLVDARSARAVSRLRERKHRPHKPLALLYATLAEIGRDCEVSAAEAELLRSPAAPIVLLRRGPRARIACEVAPGVPCIGAMLPTTPLHALLADDLGGPLVATSGNRAGEPLCFSVQDARARLGEIADSFLVHDREIVRPLDDSVARVADGRVALLRRARGYAPAPLRQVSGVDDGIVALGGHLKSAFAFTLEEQLWLGPHVGDLEDAGAREGYAARLAATLELHGVQPRLALHDAHPGSQGARIARELSLPVRAIQHHIAHLYACAAEHGVAGPALGVAWDGAGFGLDGTLWGGEFFVLDAERARRVGHLRRFPLPGGEVALREPRRAALGALFEVFGAPALEWSDLASIAAFTRAERTLLKGALLRGVQSPQTSSAGRLFDTVASLCGLCQRASFEGQAALALESAADSLETGEVEAYPWERTTSDGLICVDWGPALRTIVADLRAGGSAPAIAARFHATLVDAIEQVAARAGTPAVLLGGGCFQNQRLLEATRARLSARGLRVCWPEQVPCNDGGLAFGQLAAFVAEEQGRVPGRTW